MSGHAKIRISILNARGVPSRKKQTQLKRLLLEENIDILAVQETKLSCDERIGQSLQMFLLDYEASVSHSVGLSGDCFLFLKKTLPLSNLNVLTDTKGQFVMNDFFLLSTDYRVICVYAR